MQSCASCGRPTPYRLVTPDGAQPCCGRFRCEQKLRDGVDIPEPPPRTPTIEVSELRRALRDAVSNGTCPPGCEDCWVCRGRAVLGGGAS